MGGGPTAGRADLARGGRRAAVSGAAGIAFAPAWAAVLVAAFGLGVGFGVVVVEINVLFADGFGERATAMLNLLGACFGAGAVLGPLAVAATGGYRCRSAPACWPSSPWPCPRPAATTRPAARPRGGRRSRWSPGSWPCARCTFGVESGIGGWETTSLRAGGTGEAAAASWTAGYWAALTAGRLLAIRWPCG